MREKGLRGPLPDGRGVVSFVCAALLVVGIAAGQQIVQPGAPGQGSKILSPAEAAITLHPPTDADAEFMQGMIHHHAQAVEMVALLLTRGHDKQLLELGKRISISQTDEIQYMQQWLEDRRLPVPMNHSHMNHMAAMKGPMMDMASMPPMPGMLTPQQMQALGKANGRAFDHLFLTGMIQHHTGALVMVQDLFNTAGAGQDNVLYDFATDIDNTQRAEIEIMQRMLKEKK
ncbi:MAG: DUF305 domain-containing protein [Terriglobia bacterium]|nr:MAG: DUF305 domain-containing protein [Terriglobia bacterium]